LTVRELVLKKASPGKLALMNCALGASEEVVQAATPLAVLSGPKRLVISPIIGDLGPVGCQFVLGGVKQQSTAKHLAQAEIETTANLPDRRK